MEYTQLLRENTNFGLNQNQFDKGNVKPNLLKEINKNFTSTDGRKILIGKSKINEKHSTQDLKPNKIDEIKESEDLERDVSMMSITEDSPNCQYCLPLSSDLKDEDVAKKFYEDVITRRNLNRNLTSDKLDEYCDSISSVSFDNDTGDILVLEILDYMQELECRQLPLGMNFLEDSPITIDQRNEAISWLYKISYQLSTERYSVASGMAIVDRYLKAKGKSLDPKTFKYVLVSSWFIACKWDLLEYPSIEDVCTITKIKDIKIIHKFEIEILQTIDYFLGAPTPILFLRPLTIMKQRENVSHSIAKCMLEIFLQTYELAGHPAHICAAASYCLTMTLCTRGSQLEESWISLIQFVTGLDVEDIRPVITSLARILITTNFEKKMSYTYSEYGGVFALFVRRTNELREIANQEC